MVKTIERVHSLTTIYERLEGDGFEMCAQLLNEVGLYFPNTLFRVRSHRERGTATSSFEYNITKMVQGKDVKELIFSQDGEFLDDYLLVEDINIAVGLNNSIKVTYVFEMDSTTSVGYRPIYMQREFEISPA